MAIYLIRHTKVGIEKGICYGFSDIALANDCESDFNRLKRELGDIHFNEKYSSPLIRCRKLAEFLFGKDDIHYNNALKEMNFGDWELQKWDSIEKSVEGKHWFDDFVKRPVPNGESFIDLIERVKIFIDAKKLCNRPDNIAIVTHGGVIRVFLHLLKKVRLQDVFTKYTIEYGEYIII